MARPRWQGGWLFKRGKKNPVWVFRFREDAIAENGLRFVVNGPSCWVERANLANGKLCAWQPNG